MSIQVTVIALQLVLNSNMAINIDRHGYIDRPTQIAQIPLNKYDDGIQAGRVEIDRLVGVIRSYPKLTAREKAIGVYKLYRRRASELDQRAEQGLAGTFMLLEHKTIIIERWKAERDSLVQSANREIEPHLTANERKMRDLSAQRLKKLREMMNDPVQIKRVQEQIQAEKDKEKLRGIIP